MTQHVAPPDFSVGQIERFVAVAETLSDECEAFTTQKITTERTRSFIAMVEACAADLKATADQTP